MSTFCTHILINWLIIKGRGAILWTAWLEKGTYAFLGYGRRQKNVFVGLVKFDFSLDRIKWHFAFISRDIQGMKTREEKMRLWYLCCFISQVSWNNFASLSSIHHHQLGSSKPQRDSLVGNLTSKNEKKKTIICFGLLHLACLLPILSEDDDLFLH